MHEIVAVLFNPIEVSWCLQVDIGFHIISSNWHMLCLRLKSCTLNICSQNGHVYYFYRVHFPRCLFGFMLFCYLLLSFCSLLVVWVSEFFCFYKHFFATIHLYHVHFPHCWVCIVFFLLLSFYFLLDHFPCCFLGFWFFFVSLNIFWQQSTCFLKMDNKL